MRFKKITVFILSFLFIGIIIYPFFSVLAQSSNLLQGTGINIGPGSDITKFMADIYTYGVSITASLAVIVIMWGGILWITAAGNTGHIDNAKQWVSGAVLGLVLALTSVVILELINPDLTHFKFETPGVMSSLSNLKTGQEPICCEVSGPRGTTIFKVYAEDCSTLGGGMTFGTTLVDCPTPGSVEKNEPCTTDSDCAQECYATGNIDGSFDVWQMVCDDYKCQSKTTLDDVPRERIPPGCNAP